MNKGIFWTTDSGMLFLIKKLQEDSASRCHRCHSHVTDFCLGNAAGCICLYKKIWLKFIVFGSKPFMETGAVLIEPKAWHVFFDTLEGFAT